MDHWSCHERKSRDNSVKVVIFASGSGTTFQYLVEHRRGFQVIALFCNRKKVKAVERAHLMGIPVVFVDDHGEWKQTLTSLAPDYILLAGYLGIIPEDVVRAFPRRILNIHPSLLPKFGGKGYYGHHVHEAVLKAGEKESGCTLHLVDHGIDTGEILEQAKVPVYENDTADSLAARVQEVEKPLYLEGFLRYGGIQ